MLSKREVVNHLRRYRYDPEHRYAKQGRSVSLISELAGVWPSHLIALRDHEVSQGPGWLARVTRAIEMIETGEVVLRRVGAGRSFAEWVAKPERVPSLDRIHWAADHVAFAKCKTCRGDHWAEIVMGGRGHYACRSCVGPLHWPTMGARAPDAVERLEMFESAMRENFSLLREG
jgi:hypothetical protein